MRKFAILCMLFAMGVSASDAAAPAQRRGRTSGAASGTAATTTGTVSARAVTASRTTPRTSGTASNTAVRGRSATTPASTKTVTARAATSQKVISSGTKVSSAAKNVIVSEECQAKYDGCMDAFCMLDNESGGRCICSNKNAEFDSILAQIEELDRQTYQMATLGVEQLEMGDDASAVISKVNNAAKSITNTENKYGLNIESLYNTPVVSYGDELEAYTKISDGIEGKEGDALHLAASELCVAQMPECSAEINLLKTLYGQKVRSDCAAYENSLKQQKNASAQKLAAAEQALRQTALEQYRSANKYDLGQCTIEFKKCMQTTGGCGNDFAGCATIAAMDTTNTRKSNAANKDGVKIHKIEGDVTNIEIYASTYDTLLAKKPLCETVTKSCAAVKDQVWDTFLKEVAPQIKSAELVAEDKARQDCVGNISSCFQKACQDTIDPNDPDGSYDLCLTKPETMLNLCKVPLNACGIDTSSATSAKESNIWEFVVARLAMMRVNSCTTAVKECLQSEDMCGKDYSQCIGLDTDTIMRMCPPEKLLGCQYKYEGASEVTKNNVYDELATMVQGIMLNIDNNMLAQCQNALNEAVIKVCGDTEDCTGLTVDNGAGERSFKYQVCQYTSVEGNDIKWGAICRDSLDAVSDQELLNLPDGVAGWAGKLSGTMYWGDIAYSCDENDSECGFTTEDEYINKLKNAGYALDAESKSIIKERVFGMEMRALTNSVNMAIEAIESDPMVQFCMSGRKVQGMKTSQDSSPRDMSSIGNARFPNLTKQTRKMIASSALKTARSNYNKKYDAEIQRMMKDQVQAAQRVDKNAAIAVAKDTCALWAEQSVLPESKAPEVSKTGKWIALGLLVTVAVVATIFTAGAATTASFILAGAELGVGIAAGTVAVAATVGTIAIANDMTVGQASVEQWNYKENVTTAFSPVDGVCTKVRVYQNCAKTKENYCQKWADPVEVRDEVTLL